MGHTFSAKSICYKEAIMGIRIFALGLIVVGTGAIAAEMPDMKPGLWENSMQYQTDNGEMERAMAQAKEQLEQQMQNMPPEHRERMEAMMSERGMDFDFSQHTFKDCLTEEDIQEADFDLTDEDSDCDQEVVSQSASRVVIEFTCRGEGAESGRGEINFHSDEHYTGTFEVSTDINGKPTTLTMQNEGRWVAADCGSTR